MRSQFKPLGNEGGTPLTDILKRMKNLNQLRYTLLQHKIFYITHFLVRVCLYFVFALPCRLYGNALENQKLLELQPVISPMTNLRILV